MILFPNAKINLGLCVTGRRPDGYHDLDTIFYPIPLCDSLEVVPIANQQVGSVDIQLHLLGAEIAGDLNDNLVVRAYRLLKGEFPDLPSVEVWLYKNIPSGAGLGGGSSDATFMLLLLNKMFALGLTEERLEALSSTLGADCPFFVRNVPVRATGTGNIFSPVSVDLSGFRIVIVKPPVFISTREAFCHIDDRISNKATSLQADMDRLQRSDSFISELANLSNDFEQSVFPLHPELQIIKETLYRSGAVYASMSGSGSAFYGLFADDTPLPVPATFPDCFVWSSSLEKKSVK